MITLSDTGRKIDLLDAVALADPVLKNMARRFCYKFRHLESCDFYQEGLLSAICVIRNKEFYTQRHLLNTIIKYAKYGMCDLYRKNKTKYERLIPELLVGENDFENSLGFVFRPNSGFLKIACRLLADGYSERKISRCFGYNYGTIMYRLRKEIKKHDLY